MSDKAVGYVRVSTAEQANGLSLEVQRERVEGYCQALDLDLVALVSDQATSGSKPLAERRGGAELIAQLHRHKASAVVAVKLDRLFRDAADALVQTRQWDQTGVALHVIDMGGQALNTGSAMGRCFLTVAAGFAELERNLIAERTRAALQYRKRQRRAYNHPPLGYDVEDGKLVANDTEAAIVARIQALRADGRSMAAIASTLNADGLHGKRGGQFHASTIRAVLGNDLHAA